MSERTVAQVTQTICNALWGNQLSFHSFTHGDTPVIFSSLWPGKQTLVEAYADANIEDAPYELCKLLVATNSAKSLDALLEERILQVNQLFNPGCVTLGHLACAVGVGEVLQVLARRSQANNGVWSLKDEEDHTPSDVCFHQELKRFLPGRSIFNKKKVPQGLPLKNSERDKIFDTARNPDLFYQVIVQLQVYMFDVNRVRNKEGDLLIHVAVKGGLPQLPLLFTLVRSFKADFTLTDSRGLSPLCLACKRGEERVAEILICVYGVDVNAPTAKNKKTPLHWAVEHNHPSVVSMLLRRGANSNSEDQNRCIPSFVARRHRYHECRQIIAQYQMERVTRLAREASEGTLDVSRLYPSDSSIVTSSGCTLLMLAAMHDQEGTIRELVKMEHCPLDFKQMKSCDLFDSDDLGSGVSSSLRDKTPDPNDYSLKTAVHMAAENGYTGCLLALMEAGAHPAIADGALSWLPLHYACDRGHLECVEAIVMFPNQLGLSGLRPALDIAREAGHDQIIELLEKAIERRQVELVNQLLFESAHSGNSDALFSVLENGDDVNPINETHDWPLILAAGYGHLDLVQQLHEFGGHVTRKNKLNQLTPLHVAARGGHKEVVRYLLQFCLKGDGTCPTSPLPNGSEQPEHLYINDRNTAGCTPLELAVSQGALDVVRLLLDHGASTTLPDSNGCQLNCPSFAGTQFMMETHRKTKKKRILACFSLKASLKDIRKVWGGPSDFNLSKKNEDSLIMSAAQFARPEILQFLMDEALKCRRDMLISAGPPQQTSGFLSSSAEESSPDFLENSLPSNFKVGDPTHAYPQSALPAPRSHYSLRKSPEDKPTSVGAGANPFPQTALPAPRSQYKRGQSPEKGLGSSLNPFPPDSHSSNPRGKSSDKASLNPFPPDSHSHNPHGNSLDKASLNPFPPDSHSDNLREKSLDKASLNPFPQTAVPATRNQNTQGKGSDKSLSASLNPFPETDHSASPGHNPNGRQPEAAVPFPQSSANPFPQTALPASHSHKTRGKSPEKGPGSSLNPFDSQTALPPPHSHNPHRKQPEGAVPSLQPSPNPFPQTALPTPRNHNPHRKQAEVTVTSLGPLRPLSDTSSDMCEGGVRRGGDRELLRNRTALPTVLRSQIASSDRHYQTDQGTPRRKLPPKKPPRVRQRIQSESVPSRQVSILRKKASSGSATPISDDDDQAHRPLALSQSGPVANGYRGGVSSETESGAEGKSREFIKLLHFVNPADGCTALHRATEACRYDNVAVLLNADEELANMQDHVGNTALHLACFKAHKQTVKTLLSFKCVDTIVRNAGNEQVEDRCMRRDIRKMVAKARQLQYGDKIPEWNRPKQPQGMASVGKAEYGESRLSDIHETDVLVDQEQKFQAHFQELKEEYDKKHDTVTNSS